MKSRLLLAVAAGWFGIGMAYGQQPKPTDEDVDQAIRVCSLGTKTDAQVESGLNLLKKRILSGEGKLSFSDIPSVIGSAVQTDEAKIELFDRIQQCVVDHVYGKSSHNQHSIFYILSGVEFGEAKESVEVKFPNGNFFYTGSPDHPRYNDAEPQLGIIYDYRYLSTTSAAMIELLFEHDKISESFFWTEFCTYSEYLKLRSWLLSLLGTPIRQKQIPVTQDSINFCWASGYGNPDICSPPKGSFDYGVRGREFLGFERDGFPINAGITDFGDTYLQNPNLDFTPPPAFPRRPFEYMVKIHVNGPRPPPSHH
jgi:hypothetical protein